MLLALHTALPADGSLPAWLHLVPAGTFRGMDGRGPYHNDDPEAVIAASMIDGKIPVDENHSTDLAAPAGLASPAKGWITAMEYRPPVAGAEPGGIWGKVEWNEAGANLIKDKAYRGVSPVMQTSQKGAGRVLRVRRAALTNTPNLPLQTLHHQQEPGMDLIAELRKTLGLPETADEAAVVAAVGTNKAELTAHAAKLGELNGQLTSLQSELGTLRGGNTELATLRSEITRLTGELHTIQQTAARERATAFIDKAMADGKPINATLKDHYISRHMADPAAVEKEVGAMVSLNAGGLGERHAVDHHADDGSGLTEMERAICERMNLDPKKFALQKAGKLEKPAKGEK